VTGIIVYVLIRKRSTSQNDTLIASLITGRSVVRDRPWASVHTHNIMPVKLEFHGSSFLVTSSDVARMSRVSGVSASMSRRLYEDDTRKLLQWNFRYAEQYNSVPAAGQRCTAVGKVTVGLASR